MTWLEEINKKLKELCNKNKIDWDKVLEKAEENCKKMTTKKEYEKHGQVI